jgi:prolyl oligopeptidase
MLALIPLMAATIPEPKTRKIPVEDTLHGVKLVDPYRWLEDQQSPETRAWIDEQNRYTRALLDPLPGRDRIATRLAELLLFLPAAPREQGTAGDPHADLAQRRRPRAGGPG